MKDLTGKKVIVRGTQSGVYFGTLVDRQGQEVEMSDVRNIWRWRGAVNLTELASRGVTQDDYNRITAPIESIILTDVCEIIECSEDCVNSIARCEPWRYHN